MSSIDLVILGIVSERPQSAYDIQKDVEYHHFSRWTKVSIPSHAYAAEYVSLPLVGRTIFDQQQRLYQALLEWIDAFAEQFHEDESHDSTNGTEDEEPGRKRD